MKEITARELTGCLCVMLSLLKKELDRSNDVAVKCQFPTHRVFSCLSKSYKKYLNNVYKTTVTAKGKKTYKTNHNAYQFSQLLMLAGTVQV